MTAQAKAFFTEGDRIVNAEIDRLNAIRTAQGMKTISKNRNANSNKLVRIYLSSQLKPTTEPR